MPWAAVGAVAGGLIGAAGSQSAASTQAASAREAQQIQQQEFNTITGQEQPFMNAGYGALSQLNYLMGNGPEGSAGPGLTGQGGVGGTASSSPGGGYGSLLTPFTAQNFKDLSPAYQFQMQQGQQGVLNTDSGSQGALSGAALKDLTGYNQNMANTSFNNAFNQYQTQQGNIYSRLSNIANLGQNAASNTGQQGTQLAGNMGQAAIAAGSYQAAGTQAAANAIGNGVSNLGSIYAAYGGGNSGSTAVTYNPDMSSTWSDLGVSPG